MTTPEPPVTGNRAVDEALAAVAAVADAPPEQLVAPLAQADRVLRDTLDSIDDD